MCLHPVIGCLALTLMYVLSLYVWQNTHLRNEPSVIKKKFCSVFITSVLSPFAIYIFSVEDITTKHNVCDLMGLKISGVFSALILPLLTIILFLGPLTMQGNIEIFYKFTGAAFWWQNITDLIWLRDHVVAPLSEELTFRACMLPLLVQCFQPYMAVLISAVFFGLAHFHHVYSLMKTGYDLQTVVLHSSLQFCFTTIFGAYSAFLFLRTGHIIAAFSAHSFCNHIEFPNVTEIRYYNEPRRSLTILVCFIGFIAWCWLLIPLTSPKMYGNHIYWNV